MVQSGALSEPEGECSSCSSYENLSSYSDVDEEVQEEAEEELILFNNRKNSKDSTASTSYHSWFLRRRSSARTKTDSLTQSDKTASKESLTVINEGQKNWWYWMRFAVFMASPFIARQLGIIVGKRILSRVFKPVA